MSSTRYEPAFPPDWDIEELWEFADDPLEDLPDSHRMRSFVEPG